MSGNKPFFVHAYVSYERTKTCNISYERTKTCNISMAHDIESHRYPFDDADRKLATKVYDLSTRIWTDGFEYTLRFYEGYQTFKPHVGRNRRGVLCNGVIYFLTGNTDPVPKVLLAYDVKSDQWFEEIHTDSICNAIFEWDGRLITFMLRVSEADELNEDSRTIFVAERDPATRRWEDTGVQIPLKTLANFQIVEDFAIVASGNHLAVTGYTVDGSFNFVVFKTAENYWRQVPPTGAFPNILH